MMRRLRPVRSGDWSPSPAEKIHDQDDQEDDNEDVEQELSNAGSGACYATETQKAGNKSDDKRYKRVIQ